MKKKIAYSFMFAALMGTIESHGAEIAITKMNRDYKRWALNIRESNPSLSYEYQLRKFPEGLDKAQWIKSLKPTCSILMSNGAQIDYVPGHVAVWVLREWKDDLSRLSHIITGTFNKNDIYKMSTEEFAENMMKMEWVNCAQPVYVTFSDKGIFPIEHPQEKYKEVIEKWLSNK